MSLLDKIQGNQRLYLTSLVILFLAAFAMPIAFAITLGGFISRYLPDSAVTFIQPDNGQVPEGEHEATEKESVFPDSFNVFAPNSYMSIRNGPALDPKAGKDFIISVWVKLKKLPLQGESFVVFSKIDERSSARDGYSFSLTMEQENLRPSFYFRDDNNGTWFTFSELPMKAKEWNLFVITLRDEKYLGLHSAEMHESPEGLKHSEIRLLGGYELSNKILPAAKADLLLGSFNSGKFRGKIGPFGIFESHQVTEELDSLLISFLENPLEPPSQFSADEVGVWIAHGKEDSSSFRNKLELSKSKKSE